MLHPSGRLAAVLFTAALLALAAFASAGPREPAPAEAAPAHPDRLLVRFAPGTPESERMAVLERAGVRTRRYLRGAGVHVVEPRRSGQDREALLAKLRGSASVVAVEPDFELHAQALAPDDPDFAALWGLQAIRAPQAWERTTGSPSIVVGIVDTGIDYTHPDLAPNMWRNPGEMANGKDDDGNGYVDDIFGIDCITGDGDPFDDNGHGTSVAGVLGAVGNNGIGIAGVTWSVRMMALKFLPASGPGYVSDAIE